MIDLNNMSTETEIALALTVSQRTGLAFQAYENWCKTRQSTNAVVEQIASRFGVSAPQLRSAISLLKEQPKLLKRIMSGELTIHSARQMAA